MREQNILLTKEEVPRGMRVQACLFNDMPGGYIALLGLRVLTGKDFGEGMFSPTEVYSPEDAAVGGRYFVFSGRERAVHRKRDPFFNHQYRVVKAGGGRFFVSCEFPFEQLKPGDPAFEFEVRRYGGPDVELLLSIADNQKYIREYQKTIQQLNERSIPEARLVEPLKSGTRRMREEIDAITEALARRHRSSSVLELIRLLDGSGSEYLEELSLPQAAQLVPVIP